MLKLPHHKRYDYIPITKRQNYSGRRQAVSVLHRPEHRALRVRGRAAA